MGDVGAVGVGADDLGGGFGAGGEVGSDLRPQVSFGFAQGVGDGQAGALVRDSAGEPSVDGLDVHADGGGEPGGVELGAQHRGAQPVAHTDQR